MPVIDQPLTELQPGQWVALARVEVAVPGPRARQFPLRGLVVPPPRSAHGLLDTGAAMTCIDPAVRRALNLTPFNKTPILTPSSGPNPPPCFLYKADLCVLHPSGNHQLNLVRKLLTVVEAPLAHLGSEVLVGCDLLGDCTLVYDGPRRRFSLTY
jgi:hypothetical protein